MIQVPSRVTAILDFPFPNTMIGRGEENGKVQYHRLHKKGQC
jgi:hypothetical protein